MHDGSLVQTNKAPLRDRELRRPQSSQLRASLRNNIVLSFTAHYNLYKLIPESHIPPGRRSGPVCSTQEDRRIALVLLLSHHMTPPSHGQPLQ